MAGQRDLLGKLLLLLNVVVIIIKNIHLYIWCTPALFVHGEKKQKLWKDLITTESKYRKLDFFTPQYPYFNKQHLSNNQTKPKFTIQLNN